MTREQKLALIVGFSLVLLVGVLLSDHFSRARQAGIAGIAQRDVPAPVLTSNSTSDPLAPLNEALARPSATQTSATQTAAAAQPEAPPLPVVEITEPQRQPEATPAPEPVTIAQGAAPAPGPSPLERAIADAGFVTVQGSDGIVDIIRPGDPAVALDPAKPERTRFETSTIPPELAARPPAKTLATNETVKVHAVKAGETLFEIAGRYYGTGHMWRQLAKFNGITEKDGSVRAGMNLRIPAKDVLAGRTQTSDPSPKTPPAGKRPQPPTAKPEVRLATYTVRKGETLGDISLKVLGTSRRWKELAEFNRIDDEDTILAGTVLKLPPMRG